MAIAGFRIAMRACQDVRHEEGSASDGAMDLLACAILRQRRRMLEDKGMRKPGSTTQDA